MNQCWPIYIYIYNIHGYGSRYSPDMGESISRIFNVLDIQLIGVLKTLDMDLGFRLFRVRV
jgi:hypothetical protein